MTIDDPLSAVSGLDENVLDENVLLADGFEPALVGYTEYWAALPSGGATRVVAAVYDRSKYIAHLVARDGMTLEEAEEFFEFNVAGAYVGPATPIFVTLARDLRS